MGHTKVNVNLRITMRMNNDFVVFVYIYAVIFGLKLNSAEADSLAYIFINFLLLFLFVMPPQHNSPPPHFKCVRVCVLTLAANCFCRIKIALKACLLIS